MLRPLRRPLLRSLVARHPTVHISRCFATKRKKSRRKSLLSHAEYASFLDTLATRVPLDPSEIESKLQKSLEAENVNESLNNLLETEEDGPRHVADFVLHRKTTIDSLTEAVPLADDWDVHREKLASVLLELQGQLEPVKIVSMPQKKLPKPQRLRPIHTRLEAIPLHEGTQRSQPRHIFLVDNLPIDMTVERLTELYARFLSLERVQIFNQRPDLDPGPLSMTQSQARRKMHLKSITASQLRRTWVRPRSPVYAVVETTEEPTKALDPALRLFGMVVDRHPMRSQLPGTTLYFEGLEIQPAGQLESQVREWLHPYLFVELKSGQNRKARVGSAQIHFATPEWTLEAFEILKEKHANVHWMRTPADAEQWWKRELGFD